MKYLILIVIVVYIEVNVHAQSLDLKWAQKFGYNGWDFMNDFKQDNSNCYYLCGSIYGTLPNDTTKINANSNNAWIVKCDSTGSIQWQKTFGGRMFDQINSLLCTSEGILVAGIFQDTIKFGNFQLQTNAQTGAFIAMIDTSGNPIWIHRIGGDKDEIKNIRLNPYGQDSFLITGAFKDSLNINNIPLASHGESGLFFSHLQIDGSLFDPVTMKGTGYHSISETVVNDSLIYLTGSFSDTLNIGDSTFVSYGEKDIFLFCFNSNGEPEWIKTAGGSGTDQSMSIAMTSNGNICITGYFESSALFEDHILQSTGGKDAFITEYNPQGGINWINRIGGVSDDFGHYLFIFNNEVFLSGSLEQTVALTDQIGNSLQLISQSDFGNAFLIKYNSSGGIVNTYIIPGTSEDYCKRMIVSNDGSIITAGNFYGGINIPSIDGSNSEIIDSNGGKDVFLIKYTDLCMNFNIDAGSDTSFCQGQHIILYPPSTSFSYQWLPGGTIDENLDISESGYYRLNVTNSFGCRATDSILVTQNVFPSVFAGYDTLIAPGDNINLELSNALNSDIVTWSTTGTGYFGNENVLNTYYSPSIIDISSSTITLTIEANNQCGTVSDSFVLYISIDEDGITAFPNPTQGSINLVCVDGFLINTVTLCAQNGNIIQSGIIVNSMSFQYDLSPYPPGDYLFHCITNNGAIVKIVNKI